MDQLSPICLSVTPNLRCVGFTIREFITLIIPPAIEVIMSSFFIYLYPGPSRWALVLLATDGILYFAWALLDMLLRVVPAARISLSLVRTLDSLIGTVSFTPILLYSIYLYRLSFRDFIPFLPRKLHPYLKISLPILVAIAVAINEVSSFVGIHHRIVSDQPLVPVPHESLWFALSRSSLAIYITIQFIFFLLAFSRFSEALLDQRRIELTHSDESHYFNGIPLIAAGIIIGVIETGTGFARASFGVALARRILRLIARITLMLGLLKGLDVAENFGNLTDELRGVSRIGRRISRLIGVEPQRKMFRRISQSFSEQSRVEERLTAEKGPRQRVTVRHGKGEAPLLQIRFSVLDFPDQAILADMIQQRRRSHSWLIPGAGTSSQQLGEDVSDETAVARKAMREITRAEPAVVMASIDHNETPDWMRPPTTIHARQGSGGTVSDSLSIVRDLERKFPNLPPRVTGKYRGSILGENYEEDPFPVVGVSRQSSLCRDGGVHDPSEEGGAATVTLTPSGSVKRKPAPPLLGNIVYISERRKRQASTWGGLTEHKVGYSADSPVAANGSRKDTALEGPDPTLAGEPSSPSSPKSQRLTARDVIRRASRALSDASVRSAEWLASASSPRTPHTQLTATDIEMYRRGTLGPRSASLTPGIGEASSSKNLRALQGTSRRSADEVGIYSKSSQPRITVGA